MSTTSIIGIALAGCGMLIVLALQWYYYGKGRKDERRDILLRSAEEAAEASKKIAAEARRNHAEVETLGPDTPVAVGNKLLSGD